MLFTFPLILQTLIWVPTRVLLKLFLRLDIRGSGHLLGLAKPAIFAVNHSSEWDPILVPASLPLFSPLSPMFYTSRERKFYDKEGLHSIFYGGTFFRAWGAYPVGVGIKDYGRSLQTHIEILHKKRGSLCIFPEGEKSPDGNLLPAKGGVAYLSKHTDAPIIPVAISGIFGMRKKDFFLMKRQVTVTFGEPVYAKDIFNNNKPETEACKEVAGIIMDRIGELLDAQLSSTPVLEYNKQ